MLSRHNLFRALGVSVILFLSFQLSNTFNVIFDKHAEPLDQNGEGVINTDALIGPVKPLVSSRLSYRYCTRPRPHKPPSNNTFPLSSIVTLIPNYLHILHNVCLVQGSPLLYV
eukprot:PhF_6_TR31888/c0_g1_i1/m.47431